MRNHLLEIMLLLTCIFAFGMSSSSSASSSTIFLPDYHELATKCGLPSITVNQYSYSYHGEKMDAIVFCAKQYPLRQNSSLSSSTLLEIFCQDWIMLAEHNVVHHIRKILEPLNLPQERILQTINTCWNVITNFKI